MSLRGDNLILSGGPAHEFSATTAELAEIGSGRGLDPTVVNMPQEWLAMLADTPERWTVTTCNALFWSMTQDRYAHLREDLAYELTDDDGEILASYIADGGALLAMHTAVICGDGHPVWHDLLGASWNWGRSSHPPVQAVQVSPAARDAPSMAASTVAPSCFAVTDELYQDLDMESDVQPLYLGATDADQWPVVWRRTHGAGRVVVDLLGHDAASLQHPEHRSIIGSSFEWLSSNTVSPDPTTTEDNSDH